VGLLYFVLRMRDNKHTHSSSSSWIGFNRGTVWSDHARLVLARDTTAAGAGLLT